LANYDEALAIALREKDFLNKNIFLNIDFANLDNILQKNYQVPKSFAEASLEEMMLLIEKIHELGRDRGWHNLVLTSEETD
jgi:hypothetical protein